MKPFVVPDKGKGFVLILLVYELAPIECKATSLIPGLPLP